MSVPARICASWPMSAARKIVPVGLCGVLIRIMRVRGVIAAASLSKGTRNSGASSVTGTAVAPASSIAGR
ncbi:hypothetical protein D9M72_432960 [compost metagenome]